MIARRCDIENCRVAFIKHFGAHFGITHEVWEALCNILDGTRDRIRDMADDKDNEQYPEVQQSMRS